MKLKEITIKGFKSFGNNQQTIKLDTDEGKLCLLVGDNGEGKSSILNTPEYVLYGRVRGANAKRTNLLQLPNRINKTMLNSVKFESNGTEIVVKRGIGPNVLELYENGILNPKQGADSINKLIEDYVGMDFNTFVSFISMSINDFKNFISLSTEDRQLLLDKLFNLEVINRLNDITKDIIRTNKSKIIQLDTEINSLSNSIVSIKASIENHIQQAKKKQQENKEKENEDLQKQIDEYTSKINENKAPFLELKNKLTEIQEKYNKINSEYEIDRTKYVELQSDYKNVEKEINLYNQGKCPTCGADFNSDYFLDIKEQLNKKKNQILELKKELTEHGKEMKKRLDEITSLKREVEQSMSDIEYNVRTYKSNIEQLKRKITINEQYSLNIKNDDIDISEFEKSIKELQSKKESCSNSLDIVKDNELIYNELSKILGKEGVKNSIIDSIIEPINYFIKENLEKMDMPFQIELDNTFIAKIYHLGVEISHETISTGERKKINIAILLAYLKLLRTKKHINILFLDEIFSGISVKNIEIILLLLKDFAREYNINIFVVHHAMLNQEIFDRVFLVEKKIFSTITEIK